MVFLLALASAALLCAPLFKLLLELYFLGSRFGSLFFKVSILVLCILYFLGSIAAFVFLAFGALLLVLGIYSCAHILALSFLGSHFGALLFLRPLLSLYFPRRQTSRPLFFALYFLHSLFDSLHFAILRFHRFNFCTSSSTLHFVFTFEALFLRCISVLLLPWQASSLDLAKASQLVRPSWRFVLHLTKTINQSAYCGTTNTLYIDLLACAGWHSFKCLVERRLRSFERMIGRRCVSACSF